MSGRLQKRLCSPLSTGPTLAFQVAMIFSDSTTTVRARDAAAEESKGSSGSPSYPIPGIQAACDNVGDGKKYASRQVCLDKMHGGIANDINSYQCPRAIDATAVSQCLMGIGNEECGAHPMEAITRMNNCRSGVMCMN
jgi:hypothetical protein